MNVPGPMQCTGQIYTYPINDEVHNNRLHLRVDAFEHIQQAHCRGAMLARNMMLWHIKSADSHMRHRYAQLFAHTLESNQVMVIMEYI